MAPTANLLEFVNGVFDQRDEFHLERIESIELLDNVVIVSGQGSEETLLQPVHDAGPHAIDSYANSFLHLRNFVFESIDEVLEVLLL